MWRENDVIAKWIKWVETQSLLKCQTLQKQEQAMTWSTHSGQVLWAKTTCINIQL